MFTCFFNVGKVYLIYRVLKVFFIYIDSSSPVIITRYYIKAR